MSQPELTSELLRLAYRQGYFPMPHPETGEILWFNPDPRTLLPLDGFHVSKSLSRTLRQIPFEITVNRAFGEVMKACGDRPETWITADFESAYGDLHREGDAHSLEVWLDSALVGGVYGVVTGGVFCGESMFHRVTDASKVALYHLTRRLQDHGFKLLEVQFMTEHLRSLGAVEVTRERYLALLARAQRVSPSFLETPSKG